MGREHIAPVESLRLPLPLGWMGGIVIAALAGYGGCAVWRKGEEERHFYIFLRLASFSESCSVPAFIFNHNSTPYAHFIAESGDEVGVAAREAHV